MPEHATAGGFGKRGQSAPQRGMLHARQDQQAAAAFTRQLLAECEISVGPGSSAAHGVVERIRAKRAEELDWDDGYELETALVELYPEDRIRRWAWSVREEFRAVAGEEMHRAYLASKPPDPEKGEDAELRRDLAQLLAETHWLYKMVPAQSYERNVLSVRVAVLTGALVVLGTILYYAFHKEADASKPDSPGRSLLFLAVMISGGIGGLISTQQRLASLKIDGSPVTNLFALARTWYSVYLAPLNGAVFALVLYVIFAANLVSGEFFPKFVSPEVRADGIDVFRFARETRAATGADLAKVIIWSVIAGFAERLVPDTLNRLAAQTRERKGKESPE